jgi:hypothetical protein
MRGPQCPSGGWDSSLTDSRGEALADDFDNSPLIVLNQDVPTRLPSSESPKTPDVTVACAHLTLASVWTTHIRLNSDHLPITIYFSSDETPAQQTSKFYTDFQKADWPAYVRETEAAFRSLLLPTSCGAGEKAFCNVII